MTLRKAVFWLHLIVGVSLGLIILVMSVTGVMLAYEKETLSWAGRSFVEAAARSDSVLPLGALIGLSFVRRCWWTRKPAKS